ncbi:MAG TPA: VWA domain-containing protein [Pyrinomonadaceae bacterium]
MKKFTALSLVFLLTVLAVQTANSQSRPRRVNAAPPTEQQPQQSQSSPQQQTDSSEATRPTRPPVLGGATRDSNEQKPTAPQKDAGPEEVGEGDVVKVETTLISIPVSVMDRDGKYIPNLTKDDFHVWEDGVEQKVAYFASTDKPFTVALVIDTSASTRYKLEEIQDAAIAFVNQLRPDDKVMVVSFDDKIRVLAQATSDRSMLRNAILQTRIGSGTRLYDAVDQVINQYFNRVEGRKAIVLFTDGVDTTSKHASYESTVRDAEELDALIYPVEYDTSGDMGVFGGGGSRRGGGRNYPSGGGSGSGGNYPNGGGGNNRNGNGGGGGIFDILGAILNGGSYPSGGGYPGGGGGGNRRNGRGGWPGGGGAGNSGGEYQLADQYLHDLARVSGARLYDAEQTNVSVAFQSVAEELRRQYSLGYYPTKAPQAGERRNIKVRVNHPELVVRTRDSYVFQPGANARAQSNTQPVNRPPVLKKDFSGTF